LENGRLTVMNLEEQYGR
jgi:hypothetical protein